MFPCAATLPYDGAPAQALVSKGQVLFYRGKPGRNLSKNPKLEWRMSVCFHCCGLAAWQEVDSLWQAALGPRGYRRAEVYWRRRGEKGGRRLLSRHSSCHPAFFPSVISSRSSSRLRGRSWTGPRGALEGPRRSKRWKITAQATSERTLASLLTSHLPYRIYHMERPLICPREFHYKDNTIPTEQDTVTSVTCYKKQHNGDLNSRKDSFYVLYVLI